MKRYYIIEGDETSVGGIVQRHTGSAQTTTVYDKMVSNIGDKINCPACGSVGTIEGVGYRQPFGNHSNIPAMENDICICKCSPPPILKHSQELFYQDVEYSFDMGSSIHKLFDSNFLLEEKKVKRIFWTYGNDFIPLEAKSRFFVDLNLHAETEGYQVGESVELTIKYEDDVIFDGAEEFTVQGIVDKNGTAIIREVLKNKTLNLQ